MIIHHNDNGIKGSFFVSENNKKTAELVYVWAGDKQFIIEHTEVDPSLNGKGIGKQLVVKAVEFAREKGVRIIPLCPFAKSVFARVKELRDVL